MITNDRLGYYTVGNEKYSSKIDACIQASRQNIHPQWHFNDHVWNTIDWTVEPQLDIMEIYRQRARQIRERYDYVIINYSGGCDSQTMVDAFLSAGCHIDEVGTIWNRAHVNRVDTSGMTTDPNNVEAEYDLTTRPGIDRILSASPSTKITYVDISDHTVDLYNRFDGEEWLQTTAEHLHPQYVTRWAGTRDRDQLVQLDTGRRTAILFGVDKPKVCIKDGRYCVYFVDIVANSFRGGWNRSEYDNLHYEFFYWTPDLPDIVIKQAHLIKQWFESHPRLKPLLAWPNHDYAKRTAYELIVRSIIYPEWDLGTFQVNKSTSAVWSEWDSWFFQQYRDSKAMATWLAGLDHIQKNVDKKYLAYNFQDRFEGFVGMINGHFCLDKLDQ